MKFLQVIKVLLKNIKFFALFVLNVVLITSPLYAAPIYEMAVITFHEALQFRVKITPKRDFNDNNCVPNISSSLAAMLASGPLEPGFNIRFISIDPKNLGANYTCGDFENRAISMTDKQLYPENEPEADSNIDEEGVAVHRRSLRFDIEQNIRQDVCVSCHPQCLTPIWRICYRFYYPR